MTLNTYETGKALPDKNGRWWNRDTETLHTFANWKDSLPICERVRNTNIGYYAQFRYIVWDESPSCPWFGPFDLPTNPKGI